MLFVGQAAVMDDAQITAHITLSARFDEVAGTEYDNRKAIYITSQQRERLESRYRELVREYLEAGKSTPLRVREFYPAVAEAALNGTTIEEELVVPPMDARAPFR